MKKASKVLAILVAVTFMFGQGVCFGLVPSEYNQTVTNEMPLAGTFEGAPEIPDPNQYGAQTAPSAVGTTGDSTSGPVGPASPPPQDQTASDPTVPQAVDTTPREDASEEDTPRVGDLDSDGDGTPDWKEVRDESLRIQVYCINPVDIAFHNLEPQLQTYWVLTDRQLGQAIEDMGGWIEDLRNAVEKFLPVAMELGIFYRQATSEEPPDESLIGALEGAYRSVGKRVEYIYRLINILESYIQLCEDALGWVWV